MATDTATRPKLDLRNDVIQPLIKQRELLDAMYRHEYVLFGGAAGGGKSHILRWAAVELLLHWTQTLGLRGVRVGLFCEDYPALKDRHISKLGEFPAWLGEVKDTTEDGLCYFLRPAYGGGKIALRNLDDPSKYQSTEFAAILVDELTRNERQHFDDLRFRKRWPGITHSPFIAATNPGGVGHAWVKKLWIDRDFSGDDSGLTPASFVFIPSFAKENPHLPPSYWQTLHSLPPMMRKAMEEGSWDLFAGQYFADWRRDQHVCTPFAIPKTWRRMIGCDYGFAKPSSVGWWARDPEGDWYRYRELYRTGLTYLALAREILERTPLAERIDYAVFDPAIWGDRAKQDEVPGDSGGQQMTDLLGVRGITVVRANHDRLNGWAACRQLLQLRPGPDGTQVAKLHIFSTCDAFIRTVPSLVHDAHRVEDVDTDGEDHCGDEWRYVVNSVAYKDAEREGSTYDEEEMESELSIASGSKGFGWR